MNDYKASVMQSLKLESDQQFYIVEALRDGKLPLPIEVFQRFKDFEAKYGTCSLDIQADIIGTWVKETFPAKAGAS